MNLRKMLEREEGKRFVAYADPLTGGEPWTIGIGHTGPDVDRNTIWTEEQVTEAFEKDMAKATNECRKHLSFFDSLNDARQAVLIGMAFQMGLKGLLGFVNTLRMIQNGEYASATRGMLNSKWARQTPNRAKRMARQMETGEWVY